LSSDETHLYFDFTWLRLQGIASLNPSYVLMEQRDAALSVILLVLLAGVGVDNMIKDIFFYIHRYMAISFIPRG